jgi:hypothetical protein
MVWYLWANPQFDPPLNSKMTMTLGTDQLRGFHGFQG